MSPLPLQSEDDRVRADAGGSSSEETADDPEAGGYYGGQSKGRASRGRTSYSLRAAMKAMVQQVCSAPERRTGLCCVRSGNDCALASAGLAHTRRRIVGGAQQARNNRRGGRLFVVVSSPHLALPRSHVAGAPPHQTSAPQ